MLIHNADITGSLTINGIPFNTGSFSGSFKGTIEGVSATASYVEYTNVANKPTLVSGSSQITYSGLTGIPSGIVSGSSQITYSGLTGIPSGIVSGSSQITYSGLTGIPSGIVSGSAQVDFAGISNKPILVSGSSQITYSGLTGIPSGIVSGSAQIAGLGYATTSSNTFIGNQTITGSVFGTGSLTIDGCITATGQIVAQTLNVQQVTSSIVYSCGSNVFGTSLGNTQQFTGSMFITGSNLNANVGSACFQGSVCAPSFIGDVQSSILCSNTINLSGNNNALACNNTLRFTDTDTATELNQQIGKIEFFSCDSSTPGAGVKAYICAFAADSTPDAYIAFATQDGSGTPNPVERLRISSEGFACFQNTVCAPNAIISNCLGVGVTVPQGNFEVVGLSYFTRASNSLLVNPNYGGANTHTQLQVVCNMALAFATNGDNERMRITSDGDLILGRSNYDPKFFMTSTGGNGINERFYIDGYAHGGGSGYGGGFRLYTRDTVNVFHQRLSVDSSGIACFSNTVCAKSLWFSSNSTGQITFGASDACNPYIVSDSNNALYLGNNNSYKILVPNDGANMIFRTSSTYGNPETRLTITSTGIACFACQVCAPVAIIGSSCSPYTGINYLGREGYREKWLITQGRYRFCFGTEDFYAAIFIEMYGTNYNQGTSEIRVGKAVIPLRYATSRSIVQIYNAGGVCVGAYLTNGIGLVWCNINNTVGDLIYTNAGANQPDSVLATELQLLSNGFSLVDRFYRMCHTTSLYDTVNPYV